MSTGRSKKASRFNALIKRHLAMVIQRELDFDGALVTVVSVDAARKVGGAVVDVSVFPAESSERVLYVLKKSTGYLKHLLNKKLDFGRVPHLSFQLSKGVENVERVEELLEEEQKKEQKEDK